MSPRSNADGYILPPRICATCGKPTAGSGKNPKASGEWHNDCRRDAKGNLLVREDAA
jgi:hypothetical protein